MMIEIRGLHEWNQQEIGYSYTNKSCNCKRHRQRTLNQYLKLVIKYNEQQTSMATSEKFQFKLSNFLIGFYGL